MTLARVREVHADGTNGIHDIHMNQGSTGSFVHRKNDDRNDHDDVWQEITDADPGSLAPPDRSKR
ncbi:MAG TPA: hypothetical protein VH044_08000 [Polyangiaceae bacterium]|jgi:hypothetical protein|nr:hypothetical protein [Polyangiaceae bacterium]